MGAAHRRRASALFSSLFTLVITLHRLGRPDAPIVLNCDLIASIESTPDTVITLVTGARLIVDETPDQVIDLVVDWRAEIGRRTFGTPKVLEPATPLPTR